jgi:hypothetical protein
VGTIRTGLPGSFPKENYTDCTQKNQEIQKKAAVLDIIEIISKFVACLIDRCTIGGIDLSPAGDARFDIVTSGI